MADPPPLEIAEENIAAFSFPQEALTFQPDDLTTIARFSNGDQERKIHCNIELRPEELKNLTNLQNEAKAKGRTYYTSITVMATRYASYARGDIQKGIHLMDETQKWRTEFFGKGPLKDADVIEDLSHGILYFTGRDVALRPVLVVRAERVPDAWYKDGSGVTRLIRMLVFCMEYLRRYMFLPGRVENLVVVIDLKNLGVTGVPVTALKAIYGVLSHHYIVRVFRFYIINMSGWLKTLTNVVTQILTDRQRQKLCFSKPTDSKDWCALHHLEEDLGGTRPPIKKFFPFPLLQGPFDAGSRAGPRSDAVPNVHQAFTPEGLRGKIWDVGKSKEENTRYEYTELAEGLFKACNFPIPANCPKKEEASVEVQQAYSSPIETKPVKPVKHIVALGEETVPRPVEASQEIQPVKPAGETANASGGTSSPAVLEDDQSKKDADGTPGGGTTAVKEEPRLSDATDGTKLDSLQVQIGDEDQEKEAGVVEEKPAKKQPCCCSVM